MVDELRGEESKLSNPRPVLRPKDVASLRGKSDEAIRTVLNALVVFPGSELIQ